MSIPSRIETLLKTPNKVNIAVVGASSSPEKYGNIIPRYLINAGFNVIPINPRSSTLFDRPCYPSIKEVPSNIDIISFVVPPSVSLQVLKELDQPVRACLWFQPGSYNETVLNVAKDKSDTCIAGPCIMVETHRVSDARLPPPPIGQECHVYVQQGRGLFLSAGFRVTPTRSPTACWGGSGAQA